VRRARPSSVTVCHAVAVDEDDCGLMRDEGGPAGGIGNGGVNSGSTLCPLDPGRNRRCYHTVVLLFGALLPFFSGDCSDGGEVGAIPTFL